MSGQPERRRSAGGGGTGSAAMKPPVYSPSRKEAETYASGYQCPECHARPVVGMHVRVVHVRGCRLAARLERDRKAAA